MPSALERDLAGLLPTRSTLPPQVVSLATSLLAQSKAAAPKLKAQEEIAREYACAHIACERLTSKLTLDVGPIGPPCAPRIYNKLFGYLDGILSAGRSQPLATPKSKAISTVASPAIKQSPRPDITPSKLQPPSSVNKTATPASLKRKRSQLQQEETDVTLPQHLAELGHHLCRTADVSAATPHVYAGLERVYRELDLEEKKDIPTATTNKRARKLTSKAESLLPKSTRVHVETEKLPLIVVAIAHQALRKMQVREEDTTPSEQDLEMMLSEALSFLRKQAVSSDLEAESLDNLLQQIGDLTKAIQQLSFWQEWLSNVPVLDGLLDDQDDHLEIEADELLLPSKSHAKKTPLRRKEKHYDTEDDDYTGAAGLLPGLGTMFQPAFDWLSEERCEEYARWERDIRQQLAAVDSKA